MELDRKGISPVIGTILLIAVTVILVGVVAAFALGLGTPKTKPVASITAEDVPNNNDSLLLHHQQGDDLDWADLKISVTENAGTATYFVYGSQWHTLQGQNALDDNKFTAGETVIIDNTTDGKISPLNEDTYYHIVIVHEPTGTELLNTNVPVTSA